MKELFFAAAILMSFTSQGQTKDDYEHAIRKIGKFYNLKMVDSLKAMYAKDAAEDDISIWKMWDIEDRKISHGRFRSYEYAGGHKGLMLYKVYFGRSTHIMGISLDAQKKITRFLFKVHSNYADSLLHEMR